MQDYDLISRYNYDSFIAEDVMALLDAHDSPPLGQLGPDFPLWTLAGVRTALSQVWSGNSLTVVEFGSFT